MILLRIKTAKNVIFFHKTMLLENILMQLPLSPSLPMCLLALKKLSLIIIYHLNLKPDLFKRQ